MPNVPYKTQGRNLIQEGDVVLVRGKTWGSWFIQKFGRSPYSHVGLASWHNGNNISNNILELVEFREGIGGRSSNFSYTVKSNSGRIDIYRPADFRQSIVFEDNQVKKRRVEFDGKATTNTLRNMTGRPYGWTSIRRFTKRNILVLRLAYKATESINDTIKKLEHPVCSTATAYAFNVNDFDLLRNKGDSWMEPGHVALSPLLHYLFTLIWDGD